MRSASIKAEIGDSLQAQPPWPMNSSEPKGCVIIQRAMAKKVDITLALLFCDDNMLTGNGEFVTVAFPSTKLAVTFILRDFRDYWSKGQGLEYSPQPPKSQSRSTQKRRVR